MKTKKATERKRKTAMAMSLMQRDMAYKMEMRDWLQAHPTATAEEIDAEYRRCAEKWRV